jgi:hypothetical protein
MASPRGAQIIVAAVVAMTGNIAPLPAYADTDGIALNGTYTVVSDGIYAKTNEVFHDEAVTTSTWTIVSSCSTFQNCVGRITSDQGWTSELQFRTLIWRATRTLPGWLHCPDGTTADGQQSFTFAPARADDYNATALTGSDQTVGPSGACGVNRSVVIRMPLRLSKIA